MAGLADVLAAMLASYDQSNYYPILGQSIASFKPQYAPDTSAGTMFGVGLAQGLLGGGLTAYGNAQKKEYETAAADALKRASLGLPISSGNVLGDADIADIQSRVSLLKQQAAEEAAQQLKAKVLEAKIGAYGKGLEQQAEIMAAMGKDPSALLDKGAFGGLFEPKPSAPQEPAVKEVKSDKAEEPVKIDPQSPLAGTEIGSKLVSAQQRQAEIDRQARQETFGKQKDTFDYQNKAIDEIQTKDPYGQAYVQMAPALESLTKMIAAPQSKDADMTFFATMARILDPVGAIGQGATDNAQNALNLYQQYYGRISTDGLLTPETRMDIIKNLASRVDPLGKGYNAAISRQVGMLADQGIPTKSLESLPPYSGYEEFTALKNAGAPKDVMKIAASREYQQLLAVPGMTPEVAQAVIARKYGG